MISIKKKIPLFEIIIGLAIYSIYLVFPVYWLIASALKPTEDLFLVPASLFPRRISLENFKLILFQTKVPQYFLNSIITSVSVTIITITIATLGAYSLTKYKFPGRKLISDLILVAYIFPGILILLPLYQIIVRWKLNNSLIGLILANLTFTVPFCLWMLRAFFLQLPESLEESAMIDGCTKFGAFLRVLLPLASPGIVASGTYAFILSYRGIS